MLLYDPAGQDGWTGTFRVVVQVQADVEEEMAADPLLGEVGWSWLTDALDLHAPGYAAPERHGHPGHHRRVRRQVRRAPSTGFELRASWCPADGGSDGPATSATSARRTRWRRRSAAPSPPGASCCAVGGRACPPAGTVAIGGRAADRRARGGPARRPAAGGDAVTAASEESEEQTPEPDGSVALTGDEAATAGEAPGDEAAADEAAGDEAAADEKPEREVIDLLEPRDGLPPVIATAEDLAVAVERLAAGTGPVAVDAERASGYRYGQRAYLVQLRRAGAGTVLIDPIGCPDLSGLDAALADVEAVLHAASQDLPCLAEIGYRPRELFDTELAGRLLGYPRVALGTMLEEVLGFRLAKEHSAADWSIRPLPTEMLKYAALDVEILTELRDALADQLDAEGKTEWARQEFAAIAAAPPAPPRIDPWRRTSGIHKVRTRRSLAVVRELWQERGRGRARGRPVAAPGPGRPGDHRGGQGRGGQGAADRPPAARPDQRVPRAQCPQALGPLAGGGAAGPRTRRGRTARGGRRHRRRRTAARAPLGRTRPGRGGQARGRPGDGDRARDREPAAGREPAPPGRAAPAGVGAARARHRGRDRRDPDRLRRPPVAGAADRRTARRGVCGDGGGGGLVVLTTVAAALSSGSQPALPGFLEALASPLEHYGLWAIFFLVLVEDFGIPVPGETVIIAASIYAGSGRLNVVAVGVVAFFAAVFGDNIGYGIGRFGGRRLVDRWGKYVFLTPERLDKAEEFFDRQGAKIITIARFIEGLRQANGIIAGITKMHWLRFIAYNALGAALWVGTWVSIGYFAGQHINTIYSLITRYSLYVAIAAVVVIVGLIVRHVMRKRRRVMRAAAGSGGGGSGDGPSAARLAAAVPASGRPGWRRRFRRWRGGRPRPGCW